MNNQITIKIETDNAAFDNYAQEVARILRKLADQVEADWNYREDKKYTTDLHDINGNKCGEARV